MSELLFVYGTLMRGSRHPMARELEAHASYLDDARYNARLYLISTYPGMVASAAPEDLVFGEVFELRDPAFLLMLDDYEGCGPDADQPAEYRRLVHTVTLDSGAQVKAWVYLYNWPVDESRRIVSGRFDTAGPI
jgi:gamma-glutamylcyclotransferase (GGCT)/AIG2-like uncharacterized protein YtfP